MDPRGMSSLFEQQQAPMKTRRGGRDSLKAWAERSVWSLVCAIELGLIPEPCLTSVSFAALSNDGSLAKTSTAVSKEFPPINSPIAGNRNARVAPEFAARTSSRERIDRVKRIASKSGMNVRAMATTTMENFWKSCKRKVGRPRKRTSRNCRDVDARAYASPCFDRTGSVQHLPEVGRRARPRYDSENVQRAVSTVYQTTNAASRNGYPDRKLQRGRERLIAKRRAKRRTRRKRTARIVENVKASKMLLSCTSASASSRRKEKVLDEDSSINVHWEYRGQDPRPSNDSRGSMINDHGGEQFQTTCYESTTERDDSSPGGSFVYEGRATLLEDVAKETRSSQRSDFSTSSRDETSSAADVLADKDNDPGWGSNNVSYEKQTSMAKRNKIATNGSVIGASVRDAVKSDTVRAKIFRNDDDIRRVTRGSSRISKENFVGKLVWGCCSGWWPALIIDADHVGMLSEAGKLWVYWIGEARISLLNEKTQIESFSCNLKYRLAQNSNVARIRAIDAAMQMLRAQLGCSLTKPYSAWIENHFSDEIEVLDEIKFYPYPNRIQRRLDSLKEKNSKVTEKYLLDQKRESQTKKVIEKAKESPQQNDVDTTRLPLKEQHPGIITWAKIAGHNWWPAMIIDYRDCCMREPSFGCQWIMWYGDYKLSEIHHQSFMRFDRGFEKLRDYINNTKKHTYLIGVLLAAKDYCSRLGCETDNWTLACVLKYFSKISPPQPRYDPPRKTDSVKIYDKYSAHIVEKLNESKNNPNIDDKRADDLKNSDDLRSVSSGEISLESLCLKCLKIPSGETEAHPFFQGSLCKECSEQYKPRMFVFGNDAKCFYCTVCAGSGTVIICDNEDCPRVYCTACMKHLLCPTTYDEVLQEDPWECFLCQSRSGAFPDTIVKPRPNWKDKIIDMFRTSSNPNEQVTECCDKRRSIRVLSLFDGLSTGLLVLLKLGLTVDVYYASEIDPDALMVSASHFGDRIVHLGDVMDITREKIKEMVPIDLLIGGSPCNDLSLANPARLGLYDPRGTGILFFEYCRIMKLVKTMNNGRPLFWMYENVASMPTEYRLEMNKHLGQEPDVIDSADFSPQHRLRLYWHNLPIEPHSLSSQCEQDVQDILTPHCQRYALVKKIRTVTTKVNSLKQGKAALKPILMKDESDSLWITELEEIFGLPRHYTDVKNLSATKRQRLIGKSWSVQTLSAILRSLCPYFQCNTIETNQ
ncbi:DNA (cytosine-5)-methyltransferase 3B-like [Colletes gigas]|uniref:DNA (cytosine-5)-methyltransferase 3B-like n=1 Tax=Colletes gigas TaxID=935657 RepID=UPI001C9BBB77|nr:DNA (cytosine-5)-methyltransferase 3B-like [Colletes gigas]